MATESLLLKQRVLVLGATGYIGGRLVPRLLEAGYQVRAASRSIKKLESRTWATHPNVELVAVNVLDAESIENAMQGCTVAYYLVHSMEQGQKQDRDFVETDRTAALNTVRAAQHTGLKRIIYLSGLGENSPKLSKHLQSRQEVAALLQSGSVPVTIFRAAIIIGSGSASFEILRYLTDRLPLMITPRWVNTLCQPIAIRNVLQYLICSLEKPETIGETYDIGGADVVTYRQLIEFYSEEAGLGKRWIIPIPLFTPRLSSYWIHFITPVSASIARPLAEGLCTPVICQENKIREIIPQQLLSCREAIRLALDNLIRQSIETSWTDAGILPPAETSFPGDPTWAGGMLLHDTRSLTLHTHASNIWQAIVSIGGKNGWYYGNWLWQLRGFIDKLCGGVGLHRGRRNAETLAPGDALDFWRVLTIEEPQHLRLLAEMKLPGQAILDFKLTIHAPGEIELTQTAWFAPRGLFGILYWIIVFPFHHFVFQGLINGIALTAKQDQPTKVQ